MVLRCSKRSPPIMDNARAKTMAFFALLGLGCAVAALFGALHNQLSYTVAPEYFHGFKFSQFNIPSELHNRQGAALVGVYASWWMGLVVGLPVFAIGLPITSVRAYLRAGVQAMAWVIGMAALGGLIGLLAGWSLMTEARIESFYIPTNILDPIRFMWAGSMHDGSYIGGLAGLILGLILMIRIKRKQNK